MSDCVCHVAGEAMCPEHQPTPKRWLFVLVRKGMDTIIGEMDFEPATGAPNVVFDPLLLVGDVWSRIEVPLSDDELTAFRLVQRERKMPTPKGGPSKMVWIPQGAQMLSVSSSSMVPVMTVQCDAWYRATPAHEKQYRAVLSEQTAWFERRNAPEPASEPAPLVVLS